MVRSLLAIQLRSTNDLLELGRHGYFKYTFVTSAPNTVFYTSLHQLHWRPSLHDHISHCIPICEHSKTRVTGLYSQSQSLASVQLL